MSRLKVLSLLLIGALLGIPIALTLNAAIGGTALRANVTIHVAPPLEIVGASEFEIDEFVPGQERSVNVQIHNPIGNPALTIKIVSETVEVIPAPPDPVPISAILTNNIYEYTVQGGETISFDFLILVLDTIAEGDYHMTIFFNVVEPGAEDAG